MPIPLQVLLLENNPTDAEQILRALRESGFEPTALRVESEADYLAALDPPPTLILADYTLPQFDVPRALTLLQERGLDILFIIVSGSIGEERAVAAVRAGASDFVLKERLNQLGPSVANALQARAQREAEEAGTKRLQALVAHSLEEISLLAADGTLLWESPTWRRPLGYAPDALVGRNFFELFHPDDRAAALQTLSAVLQQPDASGWATFRLRHQDGTWRWMEGNTTNLLHDPAIRAVVINYRDITVRKQAEDALRQSEEKYRQLVEQIHDVIYAVDERGIITYMSPSVEAYTGYTPAELLGREFVPLVHPDDLPGVIVNFVNSLSGQSEPLEYRVFDKAGAIHWARSYAYPIASEGRIVGVQGVLSDITGRRQAEENQRLQSAALNAAANSIMITDRAGTIEWVNLAFTTLTGYTLAEATGKNPGDLVKSGKQGQALYKAMWDTILAGEVWHGEVINRRKDGSLYSEEETITPLKNADGSISHFIAIKQDITERKQAEESLRQRLTQLEVLHSVSIALRIAQTSNDALPILLDQALVTLQTDAGSIMLYHPEQGALHVAVTRGWFQFFDETPLQSGEGVAGTVFASGQAHVTADLMRDLLVHQPNRGQIPPGWGAACVPIRTGELTVGVLFVAVPLPRQITPEEVNLLESLAEMGGAALHRMSLHEETRRQLERLQALHNIDLVINSSMDLHMTLTTLLEHLIILLDADAADALLLDPLMNWLDFAAGAGFRTRRAQSAHIRLGESFAGRAALERHAVHADGAAQIQESPQFVARCAGEQFIVYRGVPLIVKGKVKGVLEVFRRTPFLPGSDWIDFLETLAGQAAIAIDNSQLFENLQRSNVDLSLAYDATIKGWSRALDLRDKETEGHTQRVTELAVQLARAMGLGKAELVHIRRGALLHDIGKMGVPDSVLLKPGPLTDEEWIVMRKHPALAYEMLTPIAYLRPALDIPYCHHEKWDGTGYPRGLKGEQIPLAARIFAVVDVWDALCSDRPYRPAWPEEKVRAHIQSLAGSHFDPKVVPVFLALLPELG